MKVKDLVLLLADVDQDLEVCIYGCYGSSGDVEGVEECHDRDRGKVVAFYSDICSG